MRKATKIVLLIAGILSIVGAVGWLIGSMVYLICGVVAAAAAGGSASGDIPEAIVNFIVDYAQSHGLNLEETASALLATGIIYLVFAIFCIPAAILSFIARKKEAKGPYIACIVFGALSATGVALVGGVLGLIALAVEPKEEPKAE